MAQKLGQVSEGTIVKINENGSPVDFYVAKQNYESGLNGAGRTLVVRKDCYDNRVWDNGNVNTYASSDLDSWFNSTYKNMLDADIRSLIGTTKIRYTPGNGNWTVGTLERAVFALSATELGQSASWFNVEGSALPIANTLKVAYLNGSANTQLTRSPYTGNAGSAVYLGSNGNVGVNDCSISGGSRPAFTLPSTLFVDNNGNVYDNSAPTAPANITVPESGNKGGNVAVSWSASTDQEGNLSGYTLQPSVNGGGFTQVYQGANTSFTDTAPANADTLQYRVQAYDSKGATSGWTTSTQFPVYGIPNLTVPQMVMQGQSATISWSAIEGADSYTLQRKSSADADWTQVYSGANLSYSETVGTWTSLQYRVQAVFSGSPGGWATSDPIQIVSASALVISGTDGDLGTLVNDVPYSISSDQTSPTIDVTVEVNGGEYAAFQATSGQTYKVGVLDLPTGTGSIVITATTEVSSSPVTVTRTWTYSKTAQAFPNSGSVATLTKEGNVVYPETLVEAVRAAMNPWGGNLSTALELLKRAALFNRTRQPKYSEVTIDLSTLTQTDAQNGKIINLPVNGVMVPHRVVHIGNPDPELYDASCDGVWLMRQSVVENGAWNDSGVNTLAGSTIMTKMARYVNDYDETVQTAIKTVKIPYGAGDTSSSVNSGANGLECKMFPLSIDELGLSAEQVGEIAACGSKLDYFLSGNSSYAQSKRKAAGNQNINQYWTRTVVTYNSDTSILINMNGDDAAASVIGNGIIGYRNVFLLPTAFIATYYVDQQGNLHDQQEYTEAGDWLDVWGNAIPAVKIETGSYVGTGTYGQSNPNTLTFQKRPLLVFIGGNSNQNRLILINGPYGAAEENVFLGRGVVLNPANPAIYGAQVNCPENVLKWYSTNDSNQLNVSGYEYQYTAFYIG